MNCAWKKIERMFGEKWEHKRKGFTLGEVDLAFIRSHALEEFQELDKSPDNPYEMADLFGVLIHYCIKQKWPMKFLETLLIEKLNIRFRKSHEQSK
jgi:hypothetical protein